MRIDITKLPKKINEVCLFKKNPNGEGSIIYNYAQKNKDQLTIVELDDCEIENEFAVGGGALEMIRKLHPVKSIEIEDNQMVITSSKSKYKAKLLSDSVMLPNLDTTNTVSINLRALKVLSNFTAQSDKRPVFKGINIASNGNMVATDSYKLARYKVSEDAPESNITIPTYFVELIKNEIDDENYDISYNKNTVILKKDNISYISSIIAGDYPNVDRVFPTSFEQTIDFNTNDLKSAFSIIKGVGQTDSTYIELAFKNGKLTASGVNTFECDMGDETKDYSFIISDTNFESVLKNITNETISILYNAPVKPIEIIDNNIEYIVLPISK